MRSCLTALLFCFALPVVAAARVPDTYAVGVARIDITPTYPVRLSGFSFRRTESEGVTQRIWAKALAIDDGTPAVLLTVDNLGIPARMVEEIAARLEKKAKLPRDRLAVTATHTHTAPMLTGVAPTLFGMPIPKEHQEHIDRYTSELTDKLEKVALAALADRKPARLHWGIGKVGFAINRRTKRGPVDYDLPILVVRDLTGKMRAIYVSYACHCVTLSNNKISGDWAGHAQELIQDDFAGAVALVSVGCGADSNPSSGVTGDKAEIASRQGAEIAREVKRLTGGYLTPVTGKITAAVRRFELPLADPPSREQWEAKAKRTDAIGYHARVNLARLDRKEALKTTIDYSVQSWQFGKSLAMVFLPGEVVVDYSLRLKRELDGVRLWVNAYANDAPCYIPSERVLKEGGYEGGGAMVYYDLPSPFRPGLEAKIIDTVRAQLDKHFRSPFDDKKTGGTRPLSPQQSLAALHTKPELAADLIAAEPLVTSPVATDWGADGRLWVAEMVDYPTGTQGDYKLGGRIKLLEDSDGDGKYEHPRWIPPEELAEVDVRAGSTMGRIYRIHPKDQSPRSMPRLDKLDTCGLIAALDSPNGWQRDLAGQMISWKRDLDAVPALEKLARNSSRAETRLHALCVLDDLGRLQPRLIRQALADKHASVRRHAVRLAEKRLNTDAELGRALLALTEDSDTQVRLQLAFSLGEWHDPRTGESLASLLLAHAEDVYLTAAVLSGVRADN